MILSMDEHVEKIDFKPRWTVGAPVPHLLQSEQKAFLVYYTNAADDEIAIVEWIRCYGAILGVPNEDAAQGHRLWNKGLEVAGDHSASVVENSKWIEELKRVDSVHPDHNPAQFETLQHFILLFHDSTFECVAESYSITTSKKPFRAVLEELVQSF
jgi:hypothetical protein